jgi:hypothetical protein
MALSLMDENRTSWFLTVLFQPTCRQAEHHSFDSHLLAIRFGLTRQNESLESAEFVRQGQLRKPQC